MCDYSLGGLPNRLATEGDELVVHRFPTYSMGLASAAELQAIGKTLCEQTFWERIKGFFAMPSVCLSAQAVCVPPGATLILKNIPLDLQRKWDVGEEESVIFSQTSAEVNSYRDAIYFRNGRQVVLQHLPEGLQVRVVSLGSESFSPEEETLEALLFARRR